MRVCGQCGKTGHNKRTCSVVPAASAPATPPSTMDAETLEAIEWYLNSRDPNRAARIAARPNVTGFEASDEDQE